MAKSTDPDPRVIFSASRMKIIRAREFLEELRLEVNRYLDSKPATAFWNFNSFPPDLHIEWAGIGLRAGAIIGDVVHNLRTSLDLMASELARLNKNSDKNVFFPFSASQAEFRGAIKSKNFDKCGKDAVDLLIKFSPYRGGNEALRALHDLDIKDKHTTIIPPGSYYDIMIEGSYNEDLTNFSGLKVTPRAYYLKFPDDYPLGGRNIIESLEELVQLIDGIIEAFANMVALRNA